MPSEHPPPGLNMQLPCAAKAAPTASAELPMPRPFCSSRPLSEQPLLPQPFIRPPLPWPFFRPLQPPCLSESSRPPLLCMPSQPLALFEPPPPTASATLLFHASPSPGQFSACRSKCVRYHISYVDIYEYIYLLYFSLYNFSI